MDIQLSNFNNVPILHADGKLVFDGTNKNLALVKLEIFWNTNTDRIAPKGYHVEYIDLRENSGIIHTIEAETR